MLSTARDWAQPQHLDTSDIQNSVEATDCRHQLGLSRAVLRWILENGVQGIMPAGLPARNATC